MYSVSNRINVKKGFAEKMAPAFTADKDLPTFEGFQKVEVHVSTQFEEHDELNVVMYWDTLEHFEAWRSSDAFKKAHMNSGPGHGESPIISSEIVIAKIVATL